MRFRARMTDIGHVHGFTRILSSISKVCKTCVLHLGETNLRFVYTDKAVNGGARLWCDLDQESFFEEYRIEGKDERNEIFLEIVTENFIRAMKSAQNCQAIKIKLTRKQTACLTFEVSLPSLVSHAKTVMHDVPVGIIPSRFWEDYEKPVLPQYNISIVMPNWKTLKSVVERMKNLSSFVLISANRAGQLTLEVETSEVTIATYFKHMDVESAENPTSTDGRPDIIRNDERFDAKVDIGKLYAFLHAQQLNPSRIVCNIVEGEFVYLTLQTDETTVHFCLPAMLST